MADDLTEEIQKLNDRLSELESMLSQLLHPLQQVQNSTSQYIRLLQLALEYGGLSPERVVPEIKDSISKEIIRALLDRSEQNISEITKKQIVEKNQKGAL